MHRRSFLQSFIAIAGTSTTLSTSVGALLGMQSQACAEPAQALPRAARPKPPYRVWFQPRCFHRDMSLYEHMTIDASGWLDPRLCEAVGKTGLRWVYGTNHPDAEGPEYWQRECSAETLAVPKGAAKLLAAGVAIDEWLPPKQPKIEEYISKGLRAARDADPDLFVCVWVTDMRQALADLLKDGTVDLAIVEGYTHTPPRYGDDAWLAWPTCLRRMDAAKAAGVLEKTIFSFGHITDEANGKGERLTTKWLDEKMKEIKKRYPESPGVGFFQADSKDSPELRELVKYCDQLSGDLWS